MLGPILLSAHNLTYYQRLLQGVRDALTAGTFDDFYQQRITGWGDR